MSGRNKNYFSSLADEEDQEEAKQEESFATKTFKDITRTNLILNYEFKEKDADAIREGLKKNTTITEISMLTQCIPNIVMALRDGLKHNKTVKTIVLKRSYHEEPIPQESVPYLREMLAFPQINFKIDGIDPISALEVMRGGSANCITYLSVTANSQQIDELLYELRDNKVIANILIKRDEVDSQCKNISLLGNFRQLTYLTFKLRADECDQFFIALKHNNRLRNLRIGFSVITSEHVHHFADLLAHNTSITSIDLSCCKIDDKTFKILCGGLLENNTLETLHLGGNLFKGLDLDGIKIGKKKKLGDISIDSFYTNIAKIFKVDRWSISGSISQIQQVTDLFNVLNDNRDIKSLAAWNITEDDVKIEFCKQLMLNKTLKRIDITYVQFDSEELLKHLCKVIETNNTLEVITHDGTFISVDEHLDYTNIPYQPLLEALKKNTSLTKVDFYRLNCEDWDAEQVLEANPFLTFDKLADRTDGSKASKLNSRNKRNIERRSRQIKCNVMTLARSRLSHVLPIELWEVILAELNGTDVDCFELFKQSMRK